MSHCKQMKIEVESPKEEFWASLVYRLCNSLDICTEEVKRSHLRDYTKLLKTTVFALCQLCILQEVIEWPTANNMLLHRNKFEVMK